MNQTSNTSHFTPTRATDEVLDTYAEEALRAAKTEGQLLGVRARWIALAVIAVLIPFVNPHWEVIYYHLILLGFAIIGWFQIQVGTLGQSRKELLLIFCDLLLMTCGLVIPNPFGTEAWPIAIQYKFGGFIFFFVLLAGATLAYSWRTVIAFGTWTAGIWLIAAGLAWWFGHTEPELSASIAQLMPDRPFLRALLDPNLIDWGLRIQEAVVFLIVAGILALMVKRSNELLKNHAASERERTNLARYFSPNVVESLSANDEPLKEVREQNVAVLFVDIVGFTEYSNKRDPKDVIDALRMFHAAMEEQVFSHGGTLDKYLGDGLMATFGTPFAGELDATNALLCARSMIDAVDKLNKAGANNGEPPIRASFGLHFGPVVLGDIGANRLEFAVIGNTVNVASRLEALTRDLHCNLVVSEDLVRQVEKESRNVDSVLAQLKKRSAQQIRGIEKPMAVWTQDAA